MPKPPRSGSPGQRPARPPQSRPAPPTRRGRPDSAPAPGRRWQSTPPARPARGPHDERPRPPRRDRVLSPAAGAQAVAGLPARELASAGGPAVIRAARASDLAALVAFEIDIARISFGADAILDPAVHEKKLHKALERDEP